ncbi:MAG TPA: hypothetical protein VF584_14170 [Longimicrobium sp.]|jgi:hypothetical protein
MRRALILIAALLAASPAGATSPDDWRAAETARIQAHLLGAERKMESHDVSHLTAPQREARGRALAALRRYRVAGQFPHNHRVPGARVPVFVDEHGTPCAMAYLIAESGSVALVQRIAATRNLALIRQLADDPELVAWLRANGMTAAEAARVQPAYGGEEPEPTSDEFMWAYHIATGASTLSNAGLMHMSLQRESRTWSGLAVAGGALQTVIGIGGLGEVSARPYGIFNTGFGAATTLIGAYTLFRPAAAPALTRSVRLAPGHHALLAAAPLATADGGVGLTATLRF